MTTALILSLVLQSLAYAAPVLLASLGGLFSERVGVVNIGLEGLLLVGALAAVVAATVTGSALLGVLIALLVGGALAALFALFGVVLRRDQVIVGTTLNFLALGLTGMLYRAWSASGSGGGKPLPPLTPIVGDGSTSLNALTLLALLLVPAAHWLLFRTRLGVILRATGEVPEAAAAGGTAVSRLRVLVCLLTGGLCGLGGASLSLGISSAFTEGMTNGRGFIALAVVVFGRWNPFGALAASLLFAAADVAQARLQTVAGVQNWLASLHLGDTYPFFLALPYVLTLVALAIRGSKVRPPAALGQPFEQG
ncbi:MAG: ABC transporter permease [Cytophagales bacterium]|nr:ABC transporter permease [Armatimonadota bacterium]